MSTMMIDKPIEQTSPPTRRGSDGATDVELLNAGIVNKAVQLFKLLADETRVQILYFLMQRDELNVGTLCRLLHQSQPAVSHHLALLRDSGLINMRRQGKHNFYTYLKKRLGFVVRKKELKRIAVHSDDGDVIEEKGNMDVEMTIDAMHNRDTYSTAVFFTGDSDFLALATYLRSHGKKVYVFSSKNNISYELKTGCDGYEDILEIQDDIWGRELQRRAKQ